MSDLGVQPPLRPIHRQQSFSPIPTTPSTLAFLVSWKGQLLLCIVVTVLGTVVFLVREPIASWRRRRREALSLEREKELISMENEGEKRADAIEESAKEGRDGKEGRGKGSNKARKNRNKNKGQVTPETSTMSTSMATNGLSGELGSNGVESSTGLQTLAVEEVNTVDLNRSSIDFGGPSSQPEADEPKTVLESETEITAQPDLAKDNEDRYKTIRGMNLPLASSVTPHAKSRMLPPVLVLQPNTPPSTSPYEIPLPDSPFIASSSKMRTSSSHSLDDSPLFGPSSKIGSSMTGSLITSATSDLMDIEETCSIEGDDSTADDTSASGSVSRERRTSVTSDSVGASRRRRKSVASDSGGVAMERRASASISKDRGKLDRAEGFSVMPEDGYLPPSLLQPSVVTSSSKKKKKRGKAAPAALEDTSLRPSARKATTDVSSSSSHQLSGDKYQTASSDKAAIRPTPVSSSQKAFNFTSTSLPPLKMNEAQRSRQSPVPQSPLSRPVTPNHPLPPIPIQILSRSPVVPPRTPNTSRHARKASLTRPAGMSLEDLLNDRERMIDVLRGDIGTAKAEEAKARNEVGKARNESESWGVELNRARRAAQRAEQEAKKREAELQSRVFQLSSHYTAVLYRLQAVETALRDSGRPLPSPIPSMPASSTPNLAPPLMVDPIASPIHLHYSPVSPYPVDPRHPQTAGMSTVPVTYYPSPGKYPSPPMLHPHFHHQHHHSRSLSPSLYRHASSAGHEDGVEGSLNGYGGVTPLSPFVAPLFSPMPTSEVTEAAEQDSTSIVSHSGSDPEGHGSQESGNPASSNAERRRISIESSVMKKKSPETGNGAGSLDPKANRASPPEPRIDMVLDSIEEDEAMHGLGVGEIHPSNLSSSIVSEVSLDSGSQPSVRSGSIPSQADSDIPLSALLPSLAGSDSHPSSPSPHSRTGMILTPNSIPDLLRGDVAFASRSLNGSSSDLSMTLNKGSDGPAVVDSGDLPRSATLLPDFMKVVNGERGNVYYPVTNNAHGIEERLQLPLGRNGRSDAGSSSERLGSSSGQPSRSVSRASGISTDADPQRHWEKQHPNGHVILTGSTGKGEGNRGRHASPHPLKQLPLIDGMEDATLGNEKGLVHEPVYASLAHTPAQLMEIQKMREVSTRRRTPMTSPGITGE